MSAESAATLKRLRVDRGMTQAELAAANPDVPVSVIQRAEQGATPRPRWQAQLAAYFDLRASEIWHV